MSIKHIIVLLLVLCLSVTLVAEAPVFNGGFGFGQAVRVPYHEWGAIGLLLNGRIGGFFTAYPFSIGKLPLGIEAGVWAFILPLPENLILMGEAQLLLNTWLPLGPDLSLQPQLGYSAVFGFGEQTSLLHGVGGGARLNWRRLFGQLQFFVVIDALIDGQGWKALLPMAAIGWQW